MSQVNSEENGKWLATALQSIAGVLISILLAWIAQNQVEIITSQAVLQRDFSTQSEAINRFVKRTDEQNEEVKKWISQIWPRLRAHGENIEVLRNEIEDICKCPIELKKPEEF